MNTFSRIHPGVTSVYFLTILLFSMFVMNPVLELLTLLGGLLYCWSLTGWGNRLRDLGFYLLMVLLMALMNPLFSHNGKTPLFFMNGNAVTVEAIAYGGAMGVMVVGILLWCRSYSILMTSDKFVYLVGSAMPKLAVVLSSALRYVPMLKRQARKVHRTQRAMGLYTSDSYADRVAGFPAGAVCAGELVTGKRRGDVPLHGRPGLRPGGPNQLLQLHRFRVGYQSASRDFGPERRHGGRPYGGSSGLYMVSGRGRRDSHAPGPVFLRVLRRAGPASRTA